EEGHVETGENGDSVDDDNHEMTETKQGEPSDAQHKAAGRYILPGLRKQANGDTNETEEQLKLTRQLKGLINRMSEQSIATAQDLNPHEPHH
ncbi:uncharacterized protein BJ212DRAFT_1415486, partial [Suillus subaureus]